MVSAKRPCLMAPVYLCAMQQPAMYLKIATALKMISSLSETKTLLLVSCQRFNWEMVMSFWNSDHKAVGTSFESGGGDFEPIPANTGCIAAIQQASWAEYHGDRYINIRWQVLQPEQYKNRVIFQKVRVLDDDAAKADRAKRMLAAIEANAGGKLVQLDRAPEDYDVALALDVQHMAKKLQVRGLTGDDRRQRHRNWVPAQAPSKRRQQHPAAVQQTVPQPDGGGIDIADDTPFDPVGKYVF